MITDNDFRNVGRTCPLCYNGECPSRDDCLRYFVGQHTPDDVEVHLCVTPKALKGEKCRFFQRLETVCVAYGFEQSLDIVLGKDLPRLRKALLDYFGYRASYYHHLRGEWPLYPEQRKGIEDIFRHFGYEGKVKYDRMDDVYALEAVPY